MTELIRESNPIFGRIKLFDFFQFQKFFVQERKNQPVQWDLDKWGNPI